MDSLRFNVAQLLRDPIGESRRVEAEAELSELAPELASIADGPSTGMEQGRLDVLSGPVRMMHINAGVLVQGSLNTVTVQTCARCLEPVAVPLSIELEEVFYPTIDILTGKGITPEEEDRALWIDEHHVLDLSEVLRQDALVALPAHILCKQDCRGLCPTCGQNRNEGPCDCEKEPDARWGPLVDLLNQAKSKL